MQSEAKLHKRMVALMALEDGWLNGDGEAPSEAGLCALLPVIVMAHRKHGMPLPYVYPLADENGVELAWGDFASAAVGFPSMHMDWCGDDGSKRAAMDAAVADMGGWA